MSTTLHNEIHYQTDHEWFAFAEEYFSQVQSGAILELWPTWRRKASSEIIWNSSIRSLRCVFWLTALCTMPLTNQCPPLCWIFVFAKVLILWLDVMASFAEQKLSVFFIVATLIDYRSAFQLRYKPATR